MFGMESPAVRGVPILRLSAACPDGYGSIVAA